MLFLGAIETLSEGELRNYLAYAHAATFLTTSREVADKPIKAVIGAVAKRMPERHSQQSNGNESSFNNWIHELSSTAGKNTSTVKRKLSDYADTPSNHLNSAIRCELDKRQDNNIDELRQEFVDTLAKLAAIDLEDEPDYVNLARAVLKECALHYDISIEFTTDDAVEVLVAKAFLEDSLESLRKLMTSEQLDESELEKLLDEQLKGMASGDISAIQQAINVESITGKSLLESIKKGTLTAGALTALGATGFGAFMALSTIIKAFTLLIGVTAPFAIYTGAASVLGVALGPIGMIGLPLLVSGMFTLKGYKKHRRALLAGIVAELHSKLRVNSIKNNEVILRE